MDHSGAIHAPSQSLRYRNAGNKPLLDLATLPPGRALDVGCGAGDNAAILLSRGWKVEGVTIDWREAEAARTYCVRVHVGDLESGLPSSVEGSFDLVILSHVLEHLSRPEEVLARIADALTPDGIVAIALPNVVHYRQRLRFLRGEFEYTDTGVLDRTHLRFYTYSSARRMLEEAGYEVLHSVPDGPLPVGRLTGHLPDRVRDRLAKALLRRFPDLLSYQALFLARPARAGL